MSARHMKGSWWVDFRFEAERYRLKSPVDTKRGAEEYERRLRQQLLDGTFERKEETKQEETKAVPTVSEFSKEFISGYAKANNKPSEVESKEGMLKNHLLPAFGALKLDEIDGRRLEGYKAQKLADRLKAKTVNNHLTVLHKMLALAVEWELLAYGPVMKWLKTPEPGRQSRGAIARRPGLPRRRRGSARAAARARSRRRAVGRARRLRRRHLPGSRTPPSRPAPGDAA